MKSFTKIALALTLIGGVSATALTIDEASARGWGKGDCEGSESRGGKKWGGKHGRGGRDGGMKMLREFDANKDNALTREELTAGIDKKIADNDKDGDGAVSLEEFKAEWARMTQDRMVRAYQRMDRDGNGKVTAEELKEPAGYMFDRMDRNDDGKIDKQDRKRGKWGGKWSNWMQKGPGQPQAQPQSAPATSAPQAEDEIKS